MRSPTRTATLVVALSGALLGGVQDAEAQEPRTYLVSKELKTGYYTHRFTGYGHRIADEQLKRLYGEELDRYRDAIVDAGGQVLSADLIQYGLSEDDTIEARATGWAIRDGVHHLVRCRGRLQVIYQSPAPVPEVGLLADAEPLDAHERVTLEVTARDVERDVRLGSMQRVQVTLGELRRIVTEPASVKHTLFGALIRRAFEQARGGRADDVETIQPRIHVNTAGIGYPMSGHDLTEREANLVLGRAKTPGEWMAGLLGRSTPSLPQVGDADAELLDASLYHAHTQADWDRALRTRGSASLSSADRTHLERLTGRRGGAREALPQ